MMLLFDVCLTDECIYPGHMYIVERLYQIA